MAEIITNDNYTASTKFDNAHTIKLFNILVFELEFFNLKNVIAFVNEYKKLKYIFTYNIFIKNMTIILCENGIYKYCILFRYDDIEIYINKSYYVLDEFILDLYKIKYGSVFNCIWVTDYLILGKVIYNRFIRRKIICYYKNITDEKYVKERVEYTGNTLLKLLIKIE